MTMPDSVSGVAGKPRDVNYDLLRVVAMCLVIGVHVINNYMPVKMTLAGSAEVTRSVLFALFMVCNPLFIMVSGRFNLTFDAGRQAGAIGHGQTGCIETEIVQSGFDRLRAAFRTVCR